MGAGVPAANHPTRGKGRRARPTGLAKTDKASSGITKKQVGGHKWDHPSPQMTYRVLSPELAATTGGPLNSSNFTGDSSHEAYGDQGVRRSRAVRTHLGHGEHVQQRSSPGVNSRAWQSTGGPFHTPEPQNGAGSRMNESSSKAPFRLQRSDEASTATALDHRHDDSDAMQMTMQMEISSSAQISTYPQASDAYSGHERTAFASDQAIHEFPDASEPSPTLFKQPVTSPISEEQLINEVRGIYAGLVMVEKKCIELDKQQIESRAELSESQWQALISLHRTLLYEHHDFFLASQHPSASPVLKRLAEKYAMPARMWRYGIHSFLELLRQNLPASLDYMLNFIHVAYSMMALLYESVRAFQETWIECLGDLARYRMAVEESDMRDREIWAGVSRYWYKRDADRSPDIGRIQHHLAVLARPDGLLQLFYYTKSLVCVRPFQNARESIVLLFNPYKEQPLGQKTITTAFIATHGILFTQDPDKKFVDSANNFLALLRKDYHGLGRQGQQGVYITCCNIASILQYGKPDAIMEVEFSQKPGDTADAAHKFAKEWISTSKPGMMELMPPHIPSQIAAQGSALTFQTLSIFLDQVQDPNSYPGIHVGLAFIWCLALHPTAMQQLEKMIPWAKIAHFLNILLMKEEGGINYSIIECQSFPSMDEEEEEEEKEEMVKYLAEDFSIRGNVWSQLYYQPDFFQDAPQEDERPAIETEKATFTRIHRCLWLGNRIATFDRWISYARIREPKFHVTPFANTFGNSIDSCEGLNIE